MKLVGRTSAVSAWNKKTEETRAHCHDHTRPGLARAGNQRSNLEVFLKISPPVGGRTPRPGSPTRWVCYDPPVGKVRTVFVAQSPAGSAYLVSAAEPNAARSRSGKKYGTRGMPTLARSGNGPGSAGESGLTGLAGRRSCLSRELDRQLTGGRSGSQASFAGVVHGRFNPPIEARHRHHGSVVRQRAVWPHLSPGRIERRPAHGMTSPVAGVRQITLAAVHVGIVVRSHEHLVDGAPCE